VIIRPYEPQDIAFVTDAWIREIPATRQGEYLQGGVVKHYHPPLIKRALLLGSSFVAADSEDHTVLFGFICGHYRKDEDVIHFLYTKKAFRGMGIATELIKRFKRMDKLAFTHYSRHVKVRRKETKFYNYPESYFNPYLFFKVD